MQANIGVSRSLIQQVPTSRDLARSRPDYPFVKETMVDLAPVVASSGIVGLFGFALYRAMETWVVTGPAVAVARIS
jgi:hypothetical protein